MRPHGSLLRSGRTRHAYISFTARCNLRCVYCHREGRTVLPDRHLGPLIRSLKRRRVEIVTVSALGETTVLKGWHRLCERLLDAGFNVNLMTNMAKEFSDAELEVISRFHSLAVSLDTADPRLFAELRRGAELRRVLLNIQCVRVAARKRRRRPPLLHLLAVVSDRTVPGLERLIRLGLRLETDTFYFSDLKLGTAPCPARPLAETEARGRAKLPGLFKRLMKLLDGSGARAVWDPSLLRIFDPSIRSPRRGEPAKPDPEMTRDCLLPWSEAMVVQDGSVRVCCHSERSFGSLSRRSLSAILEGRALRSFRAKLLAGKLPPECAVCLGAPWTSKAALRRKLKEPIGRRT